MPVVTEAWFCTPQTSTSNRVWAYPAPADRVTQYRVVEVGAPPVLIRTCLATTLHGSPKGRLHPPVLGLDCLPSGVAPDLENPSTLSSP